MAERSHWWTERCLRSPLCLSLSLTIYLPTYLSIYLSIDLSIYHSIYQSIYLSMYLFIYRLIINYYYYMIMILYIILLLIYYMKLHIWDTEILDIKLALIIGIISYSYEAAQRAKPPAVLAHLLSSCAHSQTLKFREHHHACFPWCGATVLPSQRNHWQRWKSPPFSGWCCLASSRHAAFVSCKAPSRANPGSTRQLESCQICSPLRSQSKLRFGDYGWPFQK